MAIYSYKTEQFLPTTVQAAWDFFSSPNNLSRITPPQLQLKVLTKLGNEEIYEGMLIDYTVKPLLGLTFNWQTEIYKIKKLHHFTDHQLKGPYKLWEHTHTFIETEGGTMMYDEVYYQLPLGFLGNIAHAILVRKKIESIFAFRKKVLDKIFI